MPATLQTSTPVFGFNADVDPGLAAVAGALGVPSIRGAKYFNTGMPTICPTPAPGVTMPLVSVKPLLPMSATDRVALATIAETAARLAPTPMLCLWQEGENKGFAIDTLRAAHSEAWRIVKDAAPSVLYGQCLMTWSASGHTRFGTLSDWVGVQDDGSPLDWYGFDTYPNNPNSSPADVLDSALSELQASVPNATIGITECNYTTNLKSGITWAAGTQAEWFEQAWAWATAHACLTFFTYFRSDHGVPWPPESGTITALASIAKASG